jgi:monoterpene epsilon-lactone hydrolase
MPSEALNQIIDMVRSMSGEGVRSIEDLRAQAAAGNSMYPIPEDVESTPVDAAGVACEWVTGAESRQDRAIMHLHGGGYAVGSAESSRQFAARVAKAAGARVLVVDYRLAPENPYPAALDDGISAYRWLLDNGPGAARTVVMGESSGGGMTLAMLIRAKDESLPMPALAVALSPWADLELTGETVVTKAEEDPLVPPELLKTMADAYLSGQDKHHPYVSPLHGDYSGFPPLYLQVGTAEILLDDSVRVAERARAAGVDVTLDVWQDMIHTWQLFAAFAPEGQEAIDKLGSVIADRLP